MPPPDDKNIEELIEAKAVGQKIRSLRAMRSMGLVHLGELTGLSASFLSQLETGRVVPTLRNLARIAMVFGKDLAFFFREDKAPFFRISKAEGRTRLPRGEKFDPYLIAESMSAIIPDRSTVPCIAEFVPGQSTPFEPSISPGLEFIYLIEGTLTVATSFESHVLEPHDSVWVDSNIARHYQLEGKAPAKALIITFPKLT
jgi:transcriptional regulator with XRE-family HTH domain